MRLVYNGIKRTIAAHCHITSTHSWIHEGQTRTWPMSAPAKDNTVASSSYGANPSVGVDTGVLNLALFIASNSARQIPRITGLADVAAETRQTPWPTLNAILSHAVLNANAATFSIGLQLCGTHAPQITRTSVCWCFVSICLLHIIAAIACHTNRTRGFPTATKTRLKGSTLKRTIFSILCRS